MRYVTQIQTKKPTDTTFALLTAITRRENVPARRLILMNHVQTPLTSIFQTALGNISTLTRTSPSV